jgi:hypothetical protein
MERNQQLLKLRPTIDTISQTGNISQVELFQNTVVRPILKFQHNSILQLFEMYLIQKKENFSWKNKPISKEKYEFLIEKKAINPDYVIGLRYEG